MQTSKPKDFVDLGEKCTDCPDEITLGKIRDIILENELTVVGSLDGEPLFATKEEAVIFGELFRNCVGSHIHRVNGVVRYMACKTHAEAIKEEYIEDYFLQIGAYSLAHNTVYNSNITQGVILLCTVDRLFQDFKIEGNELINFQNKFLERVEKFYHLINK